MQRDETVSEQEPSGTPQLRGVRLWLGVIILLFLCVRLPVAYHAPGSQDEEWYGVPGLTVAREGVPRVPYCRAREPDSVFDGAEEMLFAQPPLSFYAQSPFFIAFPAGYATARLSSLAAACLAIVLVYAIGQQFQRDPRISLAAAGFYSFSRLLFFPALSARPDMLCGWLGLVSVWCVLRWRHRPVIAASSAGVGLGLAGLTHPFAIVFAIQIGVWMLLRSGTWHQRVLRCVALVTATVLTFGLWLPLIVTSVDLFQSQFVGNILRPAGPGLLSRFVMPGSSFLNQIPQLFERAHPIQFSVLGIGIICNGILAARTRDRDAGLCWLLAISSIYLLVVCVGIHPIQGFWCYPAAFAWLCVANSLFAGFRSIQLPRVGRIIGILAIVTLLVPGAGLRATWTYMRHWNDRDYASRPFVKSMLSEIPPDATLAVGREFALDAYGLGREIILACRHPLYFDSAKFPTDYIIIGRLDHEASMIEGYRSAGHHLRLQQTFGDPNNPLSCYAELWAIQVD